MLIIDPKPNEEEAAAVLAALSAYIAEAEDEDSKLAEAVEWQWNVSSVTMAQGIGLTRLPVRPTWQSIERLRRAIRAGMGITGL